MPPTAAVQIRPNMERRPKPPTVSAQLNARMAAPADIPVRGMMACLPSGRSARLSSVPDGSVRGAASSELALVAWSSAAHAVSGTIWITELKGGWLVGASGGGGTLLFHGRRYPLSIGGLSAGLVFGASATRLYGHVSNIRRPSDVAGVYGGAGAGAALVVGARAIILRNEKGAVLRLSGQQVGLIANADLSGLAISLR